MTTSSNDPIKVGVITDLTGPLSFMGIANANVADMVKLYALVAHMRLTSSARVVEEAERTMAAIAATYLAPNRSLHEMHECAQQGGLNFLVAFSEACRDDLAAKTPRRRP